MNPTRGPTATLFGQLLVLIGLSLIAAQSVTFFIIFNLPPPAPDFYWVSEITQTLKGGEVGFVERRQLVTHTRKERPGPELSGRFMPAIRTEIAKSLNVPEQRVVITSGTRSPFSDRRTFRAVRSRIEREGGQREELFLVAPFNVGVQQANGDWTVLRPAPHAFLSPYQQRVGLWFVLSALFMAPFAYLFARRLSRPIVAFAEAAERLGKDPQAPPLALDEGSAEIGVAARAFNDMQERLRRYVDDRTAMVGAIAHDLRTPLTRLRFRVETAPDDMRGKMVADIDQMQEMITAALAFVRDASSAGERTPLELSSLVESVCDEMSETGLKAEIERSDKVVLQGDPVALRRLVTNLLENAVKFGGRARARVIKDEAAAIVEIDDDGPGIPPEDRERVFEPFYRREPSRSHQTGGIGLGLAVVRSVARGHGGDVSLLNRDGGGLTARVQLPI